MKTKLFLILFFLPFTIQANLEKFPLYDIGIKFDKPETYFLMTPENVNALRKENFSIVSVCEASKKILELALSNPNYNVLINEKNYNETITFIKLPHYEVNQEILISDISSTSFKIIDSLEKAVNYQLLANSSIKNEWNNFSFLLKFSELPEDEQLKKFSKYYSHEMNVFLYFKYPSLFHKYVHPVIKFKFEKTFIDYFLLNDNNNILKLFSFK